MNATHKTWIIIAINDEQDVCDCCGKKNLKRVVWMENCETLEMAAFGTTCAAKIQKITVKTQKTNEKEFVLYCKEIAKKEIWPFIEAEIKAMEEAPNHLVDKNYTLKDRLDWIKNDSRIKAYKNKVAELNARWGFRVV